MKDKNLESVGTLQQFYRLHNQRCERLGAYRRVEQSCWKIFSLSYHQSKEWHVKPTTEQNQKSNILHCGTNDINYDSYPRNIAEEIVKLTKSVTKDCNSNLTVSGIVPRYGKLNEKARFS